MTAMVAATERIGVIGTASTTYTEPYNLDRQFAALDHLSNGPRGLEHRHDGRGQRGAPTSASTRTRCTATATRAPRSR